MALRRLSHRVAAGDLTTGLPQQPPPGSVADDMLHMQARLRDTVAGIRLTAQSVAEASREIAMGNISLAQRTEEQASALQQAAVTMDQLGADIHGNAGHAAQADQLARQASDVARLGGDKVHAVVQTMDGIHQSAQRIADITALIDSIAFQTNILALNAAVEAARAGEQGRGFAVVAGEVRLLARRSASAAQEIKALIGTSVQRADQGSQLVGQAGQTMGDIVGAIGQVTDIVGRISSQGEQQSSSVQQVSIAVTQLDSTTQHNAALVQQSAAAAESLSQQAADLLTAVSGFRLAPEGQDSVAA